MNSEHAANLMQARVLAFVGEIKTQMSACNSFLYLPLWEVGKPIESRFIANTMSRNHWHTKGFFIYDMQTKVGVCNGKIVSSESRFKACLKQIYKDTQNISIQSLINYLNENGTTNNG